MLLTKENIAFLKVYFEEKSGIKITEEKEYLLSSRLSPIIKKYSLQDFGDLILCIKMNKREVIDDAIDAITTNETHFFRDIKPFEFLEKEILQKQFSQKPISSNVRILSAACSSGQEACSIAILMLENKLKLAGKSFEIVGIDINQKVVERAKQAIYSQFEIQRGLPTLHLLKYFDKLNENEWQAKMSVRQTCSFFVKNLFTDMPSLGVFDVIFCRNVLIYFDDANKKKALSELIKCLKPNSYIILGASETINILPDQLEQSQLMRGAYRKI